MNELLQKTDSAIQRDVTSELMFDPQVTAAQIKVSVFDGIVTLRGNVPHYIEKRTAEDAAERVAGVRAVADELEVNVLGSFERNDEDLARGALTALEWNSRVLPGTKVSVDRAWITLRGEVEWDYQRTAAKETVSNLRGVRGVTNEMTIRSCVQPGDIKSRIEEALKRSAQAEGGKIHVSVDGSQVTLSGQADTFSEMGDAKLAAWSAPGVTSVHNDIKLAM